MNDREAAMPTERFGDRVADYARARPAYPQALYDWLMDAAALHGGELVADVGCGTGQFARGLLSRGLIVEGVEPNAPMRAQLEREFADEPRLRVHDGRAEATGLGKASVRLVAAAQAFHWFDAPAARAEFARILAPGGQVLLVWNVRRTDTPFLKAYEELLLAHAPRYRTERGAPTHGDEGVIASWFAPGGFSRRDFDYAQRFGREDLRARLLSSSYTPAAGTPARRSILDACDRVFEAHACRNEIEFAYETRAYLGALR